MEKRFNVFMKDTTHILLKVAASSKKMTMNEYILEAIEKQLDEDGAVEILFPSEGNKR